MTLALMLGFLVIATAEKPAFATGLSTALNVTQSAQPATDVVKVFHGGWGWRGGWGPRRWGGPVIGLGFAAPNYGWGYGCGWRCGPYGCWRACWWLKNRFEGRP